MVIFGQCGEKFGSTCNYVDTGIQIIELPRRHGFQSTTDHFRDDVKTKSQSIKIQYLPSRYIIV